MNIKMASNKKIDVVTSEKDAISKKINIVTSEWRAIVDGVATALAGCASTTCPLSGHCLRKDPQLAHTQPWTPETCPYFIPAGPTT